MTTELRRAVFLDRDGVLNRAFVRDGKPYPPASVEELEILSGVPEALAGLQAAGFLLIVVTNQPDVARGTQRRQNVEAINGASAVLPLDDVLTCYEDGDSPRRKPNPGLILEAAEAPWHRSGQEFHDWGSLEGRGGRPPRRLPDRFPRLRLSGNRLRHDAGLHHSRHKRSGGLDPDGPAGTGLKQQRPGAATDSGTLVLPAPSGDALKSARIQCGNSFTPPKRS